MNEFYAADPTCCITSQELRLLLMYFGPFAGRYLAEYPSDWTGRLEACFREARDVERARLTTLIRRARESAAILRRQHLPWQESENWLQNARRLALSNPPVFHGLIAREGLDVDLADGVYEPGDERIAPTADERIVATPEEYVRTSRTLLMISHELHFIDPYLNLLSRDGLDVLSMMFSVAGKGKCRNFVMWARHSALLRVGSHQDLVANIRSALEKLVQSTNLDSGTRVELRMVRDEDRTTKMHDRYLLSIKGGIRFEHGFHKLPKGRMAHVAPIGRAAFESLLPIYFTNQNDFSLVEAIVLNVE